MEPILSAFWPAMARQTRAVAAPPFCLAPLACGVEEGVEGQMYMGRMEGGQGDRRGRRAPDHSGLHIARHAAQPDGVPDGGLDQACGGTRGGVRCLRCPSSILCTHRPCPVGAPEEDPWLRVGWGPCVRRCCGIALRCVGGGGEGHKR